MKYILLIALAAISFFSEAQTTIATKPRASNSGPKKTAKSAPVQGAPKAVALPKTYVGISLVDYEAMMNTKKDSVKAKVKEELDRYPSVSFVPNEIPTGVVNGVNTEFQLAGKPVAGTAVVVIDRNTQLVLGLDCTVSAFGKLIIKKAEFAPKQVIVVHYVRAK